MKGSSYIANNLIWGAGTTAKFMDSSAPKIIERINPQLQPKEFSPRVQQIVHAAKTVSGKAVNVTDYLGIRKTVFCFLKLWNLYSSKLNYFL